MNLGVDYNDEDAEIEIIDDDDDLGMEPMDIDNGGGGGGDDDDPEPEIEIIDEGEENEQRDAERLRQHPLFRQDGLPRNDVPEELEDAVNEDGEGLNLDGLIGVEAAETLQEKARRIDADMARYYGDLYGEDENSAVIDQIRLRFTNLPEDFLRNARVIDTDEWDDGDEERAKHGGMTLPPVVSEPEEARDMYFMRMLTVIVRMGNETTRLLDYVVVQQKEMSPVDRRNVSLRIGYWTSYWVEHYYDVLAAIESIPTGPGGIKETLNLSLAMCVEILRNKLILQWPSGPRKMEHWRLSAQPFFVKWLLETPGPQLDTPPRLPVQETNKDGSVTSKQREEYQKAMSKYKTELEMFERARKVSDIPIIRMSQSKIIRLVQHLTSRLRILPYEPQVRTLIELIELRLGMFVAQTFPDTILDCPEFRDSMQGEIDEIKARLEADAAKRAQGWQGEFGAHMRNAAQGDTERRIQAASVNAGNRFRVNKAFLIWMSTYLYPLTRALYFLEIFPQVRDMTTADIERKYFKKGAKERMASWIAQLASNQGDKYLERLEDAAMEAFDHAGDSDWREFWYPEEGDNVQIQLRKLRGEDAYLDFHAQTGLSADVILSQVNRNVLSNIYVMQTVDRWFSTYKTTKWRDGYVIENTFVDDDSTQRKWQITREPLLVQLFNCYWLLKDGKILPINDIYVAICMWLVAIRMTRKACGRQKDCLQDNTFIGDLIDKIIEGKEHRDYINDADARDAYLDKFGQGVQVTTSRWQLTK